MSNGKKFFFTAMTILSFLMFQSQVSANEDDVDTLSSDTMAISKDDIVTSLDMLKKNGQISEDDYQRAKKELMGMSEAQVNGIKSTAEGMVRNDPDKAVELTKQKKIEFKKVEKQAVEAKK